VVDFAVHPSGDISVILTTAAEVRIVRLDPNGSIRSDQLFLDPAAVTDPFFNYAGGIKDDNALQPALMHDAARLAPLAEAWLSCCAPGVTRSLPTVSTLTWAAHYRRAWRTLVEPGSSILGQGITSGTFDVFGQLENHLRIYVDVDPHTTACAGCGCRQLPRCSTSRSERTQSYFGEPIAASTGVLLTRVASATAAAWEAL